MLPPPKRLAGMQDHTPDAVAMRDGVGGALCAFLARYGYQRMETPLLEQTELLLRKSGGELASRMYTFTDPGGHRVSLRPEFTSSVVRAYLEGLYQGPLPMRCSYLGPVFRYQSEEAAGLHQFTQAGAEIIGAEGPWADAEVMALAINGLKHVGAAGCQVAIGHLGFIGGLLESLGLSDRARLFLMSNLWRLGQGPAGLGEVQEKAAALGLLGSGGDGNGRSQEVLSESTLALLERYFQTNAPATIGVRSPQEVRERFLRKQAQTQDAERLEHALSLLAQVAQVRGEPGAALLQVRGLVSAREALAELDALEETLNVLPHYDIKDQVSLDFGLGRGIAYYTGVVFEVRHPALGTQSLGGGGRYDGLLQGLGGAVPAPAMGFAWTVERVLELLANLGRERHWRRRDDLVLVRPQEPSARAAAVREAEVLRDQGLLVELDLSSRSPQQALDYAQARGIRRISTVEASGKVDYQNVPER
ncbi:MAG: ATP phosphoribosyltransferase regulatory subunit [Chloroflexi bacterium]|nr:ATP phosphoribosyltransferase regulatory subunit [Chloroflexota bacterium]